MSTVVALGEAPVLRGFALVGVRVIEASTRDDVLAAWDGLGDDVGLAILTPTARDTVASVLDRRPGILTVELPTRATSEVGS